MLEDLASGGICAFYIASGLRTQVLLLGIKALERPFRAMQKDPKFLGMAIA